MCGMPAMAVGEQCNKACTTEQTCEWKASKKQLKVLLAAWAPWHPLQSRSCHAGLMSATPPQIVLRRHTPAASVASDLWPLETLGGHACTYLRLDAANLHVLQLDAKLQRVSTLLWCGWWPLAAQLS